MKVVRLSTLRTGCIYPQDISLVLLSVKGSIDPGATAWPERDKNGIMANNHHSFYIGEINPPKVI